MEITAFGKVESNTLLFHNYAALQNELHELEGKEVEIEIRPKKRYRSTYQNRYYWGVVIPAIKYGLESKGFLIRNKKTVHDLIKFKVLRAEIINVATGEIMETIGSTRNLSTIDFMDFIVKVQRWAAEQFEIVIPDPNEIIENNLNQ